MSLRVESGRITARRLNEDPYGLELVMNSGGRSIALETGAWGRALSDVRGRSEAS
jgi:hypothetical protein